jgi:hypothetical protein
MRHATGLILAAILAAPPCAATPLGAFDIGMNLDGVSDYTAQQPFVNAMNEARHFGSAATPWDEAAAVDAQGWPTQDAGAVILCCVGDAAAHSLLAGTYALSFTGQATLALVAAGGTIAGQAYDAATNITTATVTLQDSGAGTLLALAFTNSKRLPADMPGTGVTNVRLIRPQMAPNGHAWWVNSSQIFTTPFLDLLKPYAAIRTMGFENTNGSPVVNWADRTTLQSATQQTPAGVAWEYVFDLANELHKDVWINVPDQATPAYVASLAALTAQSLTAQSLTAQSLAAGLHVYVEYSNEVWNYSFAQAGRNQAAAQAEVAANPNSPLAWQCSDLANCQYVWGARRVGEQTVLIAQAFQAALGANAAAVLRPVYATQVGQTYYLSLVLPMIANFWGPPANSLYAIAQAPYWAGDNSLAHLTPAQELANAAANLATTGAPEAAFTTWARYYGLQSITYEGGPGMSGTASLNAKIAANRSAAMGGQVQTAISGAAASGLSLYMYFNDAGAYGQYGMWGATENVFDRTTPKLRALKAELALGAVPLTAGHAAPGNFSPVNPDIGFGNEFIDSLHTYAYLRAGGIYGYLVNIPAAGTYTVALNAGTYYGATTASITLDQAPIGVLAIPDTGGNAMNWTMTPPVSVSLPAGLHVLGFSPSSGEFAYDEVVLGNMPGARK